MVRAEICGLKKHMGSIVSAEKIGRAKIVWAEKNRPKNENKIMGQAISVKTSLWPTKRLLAMWALAGQNSFCDIFSLPMSVFDPTWHLPMWQGLRFCDNKPKS